LDAEKKLELAAGRRAEVESAAADLLRAGIAAEEALEQQTHRAADASARVVSTKEERIALKARLAQLRPRRLPLVAAGLAIGVALLAAFVFVVTQEPPVPASFQPVGEPLKLKLEFAFPAARR
jgi:hypothetical protein